MMDGSGGAAAGGGGASRTNLVAIIVSHRPGESCLATTDRRCGAAGHRLTVSGPTETKVDVVVRRLISAVRQLRRPGFVAWPNSMAPPSCLRAARTSLPVSCEAVRVEPIVKDCSLLVCWRAPRDALLPPRRVLRQMVPEETLENLAFEARSAIDFEFGAAEVAPDFGLGRLAPRAIARYATRLETSQEAAPSGWSYEGLLEPWIHSNRPTSAKVTATLPCLPFGTATTL